MSGEHCKYKKNTNEHTNSLHGAGFSSLRRTQTLHASLAAGTSLSVATPSFLVGPVSAPPVAYPISYGHLPTSNIPPVAAPPAEPVAPAFVVPVFLGSFLFLFLCCLFLKALELENCPSIVPRPRNLSFCINIDPVERRGSCTTPPCFSCAVPD